MGYKLLSCPHSLHLSFKDHSNEVQTCVNIYFMLINSPDCFTCLFRWYGLLIMVGGVGCVGGDFSQTHRNGGNWGTVDHQELQRRQSKGLPSKVPGTTMGTD